MFKLEKAYYRFKIELFRGIAPHGGCHVYEIPSGSSLGQTALIGV
jgi:hypothetical protein